MKWHWLLLIHGITCPVRRRWRRHRIGQPFWADDKVAAMLGIAHLGCRRCGRGAIEERDRLNPAPVADPDDTKDGALNLSPQRCDSCNAAELVMRYSPDHGATFCIPCHERENR